MSIIIIRLFLYCYLVTLSRSEENLKCKSKVCCEQWDEDNEKCAVCSPGFIGWNCSEICPYPNYGRECQDECKCEKSLCDIAAGCYPLDDGCRSGYFGHRCMNKCKYPNYGKGCQSNCACLEENCNFINGCYVPENTSYNLDNNQFNEAGSNGNGSDSLGVVLLVSAVTSISLSIFITLMVWRIRRLRKSKTGSPRRDRTNERQVAQSNGYASDARPSRFYSSNVQVSATRHESEDDPYLAMCRENSDSCKNDYSEYVEVKCMAGP